MAYQHQNLIVCGVDGSEQSLRALEWAVNDAIPREAGVELVTAYDEPSDAVRVREWVVGLAQRTREKYPELVSVRATAVYGSATDALLERSKVARHMVIGQHGAHHTSSVRGATARAVSSRAYSSVIVVPETDREVLPIRHIIAGVDGSEAGTHAYAVAANEAKYMKARLSGVEVVRIPSTGPLMAANITRDVLEDTRNELALKLTGIAEQHGVAPEYHAIEGVPSQVLSEFSTAVDLIVVGTSGGGGIRGMILGSTAENLLNAAYGPVMVVPERTLGNEFDETGASAEEAPAESSAAVSGPIPLGNVWTVIVHRKNEEVEQSGRPSAASGWDVSGEDAPAGADR